MTKYPERVPLTEVGNYTDTLKIGDSWLPESVDRSAIDVDLNSYDLIRKVIGIKTVEVANIDATGKAHRSPLKDVIIDFPTRETRYDNPTVTIVADRTKIRKQLQAAQRQPSPEQTDSTLHAKMINDVLKSGLGKTNLEANITILSKKGGWLPMRKWQLPLPYALLVTPITTEIALSNAHTGPEMLKTLGLLAIKNLAMVNFGGPSLDLMLRRLRDDTGKHPSYLELVKRYRKSLFYGAAYDRYVMGFCLLATHDLIVVEE